MAEPALAIEPPFRFYPGEVEVLRPRPRVSTFDWCREHLRVVSGPYRGQLWRADLLPYARGIMDAFDRPEVRAVYIIAPSQSGKTTIAYGCLLCRQVKRPGPSGILMPDQEGAERIFEAKLIPHVQRAPALRLRLAPSRYALQKTEIRWRDGSSTYALWSGSESRMSSVSLETMLIDEEDANQDKSAVGTAQERLVSYPHTSKLIRFSKVRGTEEDSTIWRDMHAEAQVMRYLARCPNELCGHEQYMRFEQIKVPDGERDPSRILEGRLARYECEECGYQWTDHERDKALALGRWEAVDGGSPRRAEKIGFRLRSWELPFVNLSKVMADWFAAQGDPRKLQLFDNHHAAKPYKTVVVQTSEDELLRLRDPEVPPGVVPARALALTMAVDMQKRDFWYSVWAHALDPREDWVIEYGKIPDWEALGLMLDLDWPVAGTDRRMGLWRAALDTGGGAGEGEDASRTQQAMEWLWRQPSGRILGTKGMSRKSPGEYVKWSDKMTLPNGRKLPHALRLYLIDTDEAKRVLLHSRLREEAVEPVRFHAETGPEYVRQLMAEELVREKGREVWKKRRRDNHWLDCAVLHWAMAHMQWVPNLRMVAMAAAEQKQAGPEPAAGRPWVEADNYWRD